MPIPDLPFYRQSKPMNVVRLPTSRAIRSDRGYFRVRFIDMRLARDWVATSILAPALHAVFELEQSLGGSYEVVIGATVPPNAKGGDLRRTYIAPQALTPVLPYDGRKTDAQLGLFSVPVKDLAAEMLDLLGVLASTTQRADLIIALGITDMLRRGINALFGLDGVTMLLSWQGEIGGIEKIQQEYTIVTPSRPPLDKRKLAVTDGRLYLDGKMIDHVNYMVFAVEVSDRRTDWRTLPEIKQHFDAWNNARSIYNLPAEDYNRCVTRLLGALRTSPNIIPIDAERIVKEEIRPLLEMGNEVQESLFRSAGFDVDALMETHWEDNDAMGDFVELDADGANADNLI